MNATAIMTTFNSVTRTPRNRAMLRKCVIGSQELTLIAQAIPDTSYEIAQYIGQAWAYVVPDEKMPILPYAMAAHEFTKMSWIRLRTVMTHPERADVMRPLIAAIKMCPRTNPYYLARMLVFWGPKIREELGTYYFKKFAYVWGWNASPGDPHLTRRHEHS
ncbi:hypothetical protein G3N56_07710 [Desulfovibrio sulfodismutans]|uniref:Uncharacterized protein n=1 Tax=Desulfolutivibrio sulfodismutans TaxID=63561 RepID=A0A7K3NKI8_9BACT|nr:hypothetical protein [Desulfolutivibrio sulfodismutans]NDY56627.1 hypothetical protein [Desulfolutivibrio sulfodismutans]QLA11272.1 hypothetical protein GD606_02745 [Desulfolutivibrio sulfodismutans DSM 3696]